MTITAMPQTDAAAKPKGSKRKLILAVVAVLVILGAGAWFVLKPAGKPAAPKPGPVVKLDSIQLNLAGGHYLRLGLALQETTSAKEDVDGSKALDAAIDLFSGQSVTDLDQGQARNALKTKLSHTVTALYEGDVMGIYFTEFVTQ
ncbi:MAG: flagellar basal body-associated FliL family protein [Nocardioides sp.]|uniref:flagellar basal body-associated FliL family protein n=1 Tax=Nocardioides nematodiphilus TaxID=2849669 RepID=UPI001CD9D593|nr:flagellar basal body-associated FliL family protein [Nocardioides nematodiphilus]MCA1984278.1 flagellar basal body-associated FliL family protein [Nocardioides nematodiphilus]